MRLDPHQILGVRPGVSKWKVTKAFRESIGALEPLSDESVSSFALFVAAFELLTQRIPDVTATPMHLDLYVRGYVDAWMHYPPPRLILFGVLSAIHRMFEWVVLPCAVPVTLLTAVMLIARTIPFSVASVLCLVVFAILSGAIIASLWLGGVESLHFHYRDRYAASSKVVGVVKTEKGSV